MLNGHSAWRAMAPQADVGRPGLIGRIFPVARPLTMLAARVQCAIRLEQQRAEQLIGWVQLAIVLVFVASSVNGVSISRPNASARGLHRFQRCPATQLPENENRASLSRDIPIMNWNIP